MSKERLGEIDKRAEHRVLENSRGEVRYRFTEINTEDFDWLIEQAEQVRGLEENAQDLRAALGKRQEQVKRYREAIERALGESGWGDEGNALYRTIGILTKALEGEE